MTVDVLRSFRQDFAGCEIAVLVDVSTRTVLAWDSDPKWPQEQLDELCDLAARVLAVDPPGLSDGAGMKAMLVRETGCHVFLRTAPGTAEVFGCILAPGASIDGLFGKAAQLCTDLLASDDLARA